MIEHPRRTLEIDALAPHISSAHGHVNRIIANPHPEGFDALFFSHHYAEPGQEDLGSDIERVAASLVKLAKAVDAIRPLPAVDRVESPT